MDHRELLIRKIENSINAIDELNLPKDSHSKYLLNHLRDYLEKTKIGNYTDLINAADKFGMYCIEHMDWDTEEYKLYINLVQLGRKIAKREKMA